MKIGFVTATLLGMLCFLPTSESRADEWAILIGINDYNQATDLRYCCADQMALGRHLIEGGFPEEQVFFLTSNTKDKRRLPFHANIEKQLDNILNLVEYGDVVVFAFSGHGVQLNSENYLLPMDGDVSKPETLIPVNDIYERLQKSGASMKLMLVDACKNDPEHPTRSLLGPVKGSIGPLGNARETIPDGIMMLSSCSAGEYSYEDPELKQGVWMHFVLEGLRGKADKDGNKKVSVTEIANYTCKRTGLHVLEKFNGKQKPWVKNDGEFEVLQFSVAEIRNTKNGKSDERLAYDNDDSDLRHSTSSNGNRSLPAGKSKSGFGEKYKELKTLVHGFLENKEFERALKVFSGVITSSDFNKEEKMDARKMRMGMYLARRKSGDIDNAIIDATFAGVKGIPISVTSDSLLLQYKGENGNVISTTVSRNNVLTVSQMNKDFYWVSSVNGDESRRGWLDREKLKVITIAPVTTVPVTTVPVNKPIHNSGTNSFVAGHYQNDFDYGFDFRDALAVNKAESQELDYLKKQVANPRISGLTPLETFQANKLIDNGKRLLELENRQIKQEAIREVFNAARQLQGRPQFQGFGGGGLFGGR